MLPSHNCRLKTLLLSRSECDLTIKTKPILLEIFLILLTVLLREVILDAVDLE